MADATSLLRAEVIEKTINVEWLLHAIISQHYFGQVRIKFVHEVLYDEYCSFALKRRVVLKICPELHGKVENQLNRLNAIRNCFAHVGQTVIDGPDPGGVSRVPSPRDFSDSIDFKVLHNEFKQIEGPLVNALAKAYQDKGGIFIS
jgi:hypothetical protein